MPVKPKSGFGGKTKFSQIVMTLDECQKRRRCIDETQPNEALRTRFPLMCAHLFWLEITWTLDSLLKKMPYNFHVTETKALTLSCCFLFVQVWVLSIDSNRMWYMFLFKRTSLETTPRSYSCPPASHCWERPNWLGVLSLWGVKWPVGDGSDVKKPGKTTLFNWYRWFLPTNATKNWDSLDKQLCGSHL